MYKSREMGDVVKDVPANANELTEEVSTSRPSIVVHSALVTDRQKSAKGEGDVGCLNLFYVIIIRFFNRFLSKTLVGGKRVQRRNRA